MEIVRYESKHYGILVDWWKQYNYPPVPQDVLPKRGFFAFDGNKPVAFTCTYLSEEPIAFVAFTIVDKHVEGFKKYKGISMVVDALKEEAKKCGKHALYSFTANETLVSIYQKKGFLVSEKNCVSLIAPLDNQGVDYLKE